MHNGNGYIRTFSLVLGIVIAVAGGSWAAKGYVDGEIKDHGHIGLVTNDDLKEVNKKLDDIKDRLARIEGKLER